MLNDCKLTPSFSVLNWSLILHYWMMVMVVCYSLPSHWLLPGVNAHTLDHTFTCHCHGRFASNGRPFICYLSMPMDFLIGTSLSTLTSLHAQYYLLTHAWEISCWSSWTCALYICLCVADCIRKIATEKRSLLLLMYCASFPWFSFNFPSLILLYPFFFSSLAFASTLL